MPGARETQVLTDAEDVRRLIDAAGRLIPKMVGAAISQLILVLAATGARFSQIIQMLVADVQASRLMVPVSNKGRGVKYTTRIAVRVGEDAFALLGP